MLEQRAFVWKKNVPQTTANAEKSMLLPSCHKTQTMILKFGTQTLILKFKINSKLTTNDENSRSKIKN